LIFEKPNTFNSFFNVGRISPTGKVFGHCVLSWPDKEEQMINDVVLEGIVTKTWKFAGDLLFRLACFRDPDMPQRPLNETQDMADFVTIRVIKGNLSAPVSVEYGTQVRVHGFIQSRDYEESLADFLKDARGAELPVPEGLDPTGLRATRGSTEIVARRIMSQKKG
jgi:hypothetical protein